MCCIMLLGKLGSLLLLPHHRHRRPDHQIKVRRKLEYLWGKNTIGLLERVIFRVLLKVPALEYAEEHMSC